MSAPISNRFSKLSIYSEEMQSPRGQKGGPLRGKGKEPLRPNEVNSEEEEEEQEQEQDDDNESDISDHENQDSDGHEHVLALYGCRQINPEHKDPNKRRYSFVIADAHIGTQGVQFGSSDTAPRCSCGEKGTCRHMLWLLEQLSLAGVDITGDTQIGYYGQIASIGLESICENRHWEFAEGHESSPVKWQLTKAKNHIHRGSQTRASIQKRIGEIRDILATLSDLFLDDYPSIVFDNLDDLTEDSIYVKNDLYATLSRLLILDESLLDRFNRIVPPNVRASDYFYKIERKAKEACRQLDVYVEAGPAPSSTIQHDVPWCAQELVDIVKSIGANIVLRQPLNPSSRRAAAQALVSILTEVVIRRNTDVYQNNRFPRRRPHAEAMKDQNIYVRLIGEPSPHNPPGNFFVLEHLENLPEARFFIGELEDVHRHLSGIGWGPAPRDYRDRLSGLIANLEGNTSGLSSSSSTKRPGSSHDRKGNKRMK